MAPARVLVRLPNWLGDAIMARPLLHAPQRAWGSIQCAPDGRALVAQSAPASNDPRFFATRWALWRVGLDGSLRRLTSPPRGVADDSPRWSRDGRSILFVRSRLGSGRLYAWRDGRVLGPFAWIGYRHGYYGHRDTSSAGDDYSGTGAGRGCTYCANEVPGCPPTDGVHLEFLGLIVDRCRGTVAAKSKWVVDL